MKTARHPGIIILLLFFFTSAYSEVKLPQILSSNMVLQRNQPIKIWGWADKNERVSVTLDETTLKTKAGKDGSWSVTFESREEGGPFSIKVVGKNELVLENILMGDVWICSGQSNMEWSVTNSDSAQIEIENANFPEIRLLSISHNFHFKTVDDVPKTGWKVCSSETIPSFSAVGYFFGRNIHKKTGVPVGLISTNWGGTNIEAWISRDYISRYDVFAEKISMMENFDAESFKQKQKEASKNLLEDFKLNPDNPVKEDWSAFDVDYSLWKEVSVPGLWESKGLQGIDGTVWYRKEFELPSEIAAKGIKVFLGAIDDSDETWVNGVKIGGLQNQYNTDRVYDVSPEILRAGKNVIAVRIEDYQGGGGFSSGEAVLRIESGRYSQPLAGLWKYKLTAELLSFAPLNPLNPNEVPSSLFNGMIYPLLNLPVTGAIWYQGESNADRAYQYRELMPLLIQNWRDKWGQADMPFFMVQLANYMQPEIGPTESNWAELREAQSLTEANMEKVGMAVIIDIGEANDIHPRNKQDVGYRLALSALKIAYGKDIVYRGPVYKSVEFDGNKAIISFTDIGAGLDVKDKYGYVKGFAIAGEDKKFHWAKAKIMDGNVVVSAENVEKPVAVRYAWANNPDDANLYNKEGLPASPFRTDDWKGITYGVE